MNRSRIAAVWLLAAAAGLTPAASPAQAPTLNAQLQGDISPTHDPVLIREGAVYHVFSTGLGDGPDRILSHRI